MTPVDAKHSQIPSYRYFRYVDDILILCAYSDINQILGAFTEDCQHIQLELYTQHEDPNKALSGRISDGFSYLGYIFTPNKISVRKKSIDNLRESIIKILKIVMYKPIVANT